MTKTKEKLTSAEFDNKVVSMIRNGSSAEKEEGFSLLFNKYKKGILFKLSSSLKFDMETANDLLMDVFTKVYLKIDLYSQEEGALSTWIYTITKNTLLDHFSKEKYNSQVLSLDSFILKDSDDSLNFGSKKTGDIEDDSIKNNSLDLMVRDERAKALVVALNKIKRDEVRKVLILFYFEEKNYKEISSELNITKSQIKIFLYRGKAELRNILGADFI
jgi:RNA polymerase sigma-70 factor (ECF subfamily)